MHGKEFVKDVLTTYFTLVTLITGIMLVMGMRLYPDASFGYAAFATPLIYGAAGVLPNVVMYSKRELSAKEFLVRKVIQFVLVEVIALYVGFGGETIHAEKLRQMAVLGFVVFVVYVLAHVVDWVEKWLSAKRMTEDLVRFQQNSKWE